MGDLYKISVYFDKKAPIGADRPNMEGYVSVDEEGAFQGIVEDLDLVKRYIDEIRRKAKYLRAIPVARRSVYGYHRKSFCSVYIGTEHDDIFNSGLYGFMGPWQSGLGRFRSFANEKELAAGNGLEKEAYVRFEKLTVEDAKIALRKLNSLSLHDDAVVRRIWRERDDTPLTLPCRKEPAL